MSEWQPIETAPRDGTMILVWDESSISVDVRDARDEELRKQYYAGERFYRKYVAAKMSDTP